MVFRGKNHAGHARFLRGPHNLVGIEIGRVEHLFALVAVTPLLVGECVHREVQEAVELHAVPAKLPLGGQGAVGSRGSDRVAAPGQRCQQGGRGSQRQEEPKEMPKVLHAEMMPAGARESSPAAFSCSGRMRRFRPDRRRRPLLRMPPGPAR